MGDDARPQAHVRRADRAGRADARARGGDQGQPRLPRALDRRLGLAGVHRDREALRARPGGRLRPAGARHAAVAQRARLPRRPAAADLVPGGPGAEGAAPADRHRDARARPRRGAAARRRCAGSPASICIADLADVLRAARRHDRGLQRPRGAGRGDAARARRPAFLLVTSAAARADRRGDLVSPHARARGGCRSPAWSSTACTTTCCRRASPPTSARRFGRTALPADLAARVAENFHDYHVLARRDDRNIDAAAQGSSTAGRCCWCPSSTTTSTTSTGCCACTATCSRQARSASG